jgi:hypothetical protein
MERKQYRESNETRNRLRSKYRKEIINPNIKFQKEIKNRNKDRRRKERNRI